jgi:ribosome-binding protein aMBF1 (putative translation factor)
MRTFSQWLEWHHYAAKKSPVVTPQYTQVWVSIRDAERKKGISYGKLARNIDLKPETLQAVIQSLVDFGKVAVSMERGQRIYRPA